MKQVFIIFLSLFFSCEEETCESTRTREMRYHLNIISSLNYKENFNQNPYFEIRGINPETQNNNLFKDEGRWMSTYSDSIQKGDTIYKEFGTDYYLIKKKNRIIKIYTFKCKNNGERDRESIEVEVIRR
ncbi:hypothetical protein [Empedobacter brevis]|uniref:hypothetical protein n=1 Tax=Empedobacter brevis TaxID=247 RepID=UPI00333FB649